MDVDRLGLVRPQRGRPTMYNTWVLALALLIGLFAEVEMVSALIRRPGSSFIAASGRGLRPAPGREPTPARGHGTRVTEPTQPGEPAN